MYIFICVCVLPLSSSREQESPVAGVHLWTLGPRVLCQVSPLDDAQVTWLSSLRMTYEL